MTEPGVDVGEDETEDEEGGKKSAVADGSDGCAILACDALPGGCDGCDGCDPGCNLMLGLFRLSTLLLLVAALTPARGADRVVAALIRGYRRHLTRWTPACPSTPSCSAHALAEVHRLGARRGLVAAAARIRSCRRG